MKYETIITLLKEFDYDKNTKEDVLEFLVTMTTWMDRILNKED